LAEDDAAETEVVEEDEPLGGGGCWVAMSVKSPTGLTSS